MTEKKNTRSGSKNTGRSPTRSSSAGKKRSAPSKDRELTASVRRSASASASSSSRAKKTVKLDERERISPERADEITGVVLIALGVVMGILTYTKTTAFLSPMVDFFFGLVGFIQYAMPVLLVATGVALIAIPNRQVGRGAVAMIAGAILCVNCIIHIASVPIGDAAFGRYIASAYELGKLRRGGGFLSAIPAYALSKLVSSAGAIVIFVAIVIVLLLLATRISIRSAGRKIAAQVDAFEDRRKARLIDERVGEDYAPVRRRRTGSDTVEASSGDELKLGSDTERRGIKRRREKLKPVPSGMGAVISENETAPSSGAIDFIPKEGPLSNETVPDYPISNAGSTPLPDYDPFETIEINPADNITGDTPDLSEDKTDGTKAAENGDEPIPAGELAEPAAVRVYQRPPLSLLRNPDRSETIANDSPQEKAKLLIETLASFNINARVINISVGPVITRFEIQPAQGVRVNRITSLSNDIALALAAPRVRIEAPIPGKAAVGIEIPNKDTAMVRLREVLDTREFSAASSPLTFGLGKDIAGKPVYANLEKMPHMLIAGATGSGKSVCINSIILSTVYKSSPDEVRMILIDPKVVELSIFAPVPHLYCPIVTDPKKAAGVLKWACNEMDQRYAKMSKVNARDIERYNSLQDDKADRMPRLMIIIDELADLMIVSAKDVEDSIARLAQLGRACGIHLIVATQRPSTDIITGLIKANIPSRIAFAVSSAIDSRVILDMGGAEKLLGHGDMLFHPNGAAKPIRAQGAYVSDEEVENIMQFFVDNGVEVPQNNNVLEAIPDLTGAPAQGNGKQEDDLLPDAVRIVMDSGSASISMIQRRLRVGYARAARLVDIMEQKKFVSGFDGSKPRKVLIDEAGYAEFFGTGGDEAVNTDE